MAVFATRKPSWSPSTQRRSETDGGGVYDGREDAEGTNPLDPDDDVVLVDDDKPEGCGCATTDRSAAWVLLLAVVGLRRRRG